MCTATQLQESRSYSVYTLNNYENDEAMDIGLNSGKYILFMIYWQLLCI